MSKKLITTKLIGSIGSIQSVAKSLNYQMILKKFVNIFISIKAISINQGREKAVLGGNFHVF